MAKEIKTEILIGAGPAKVWETLTDFDNYPAWNPFIRSLTGEVAVGNKIKVVLQGMTFVPRVLTFEKNREFRWLGHLFVKGLFDGEHKFELIDNKNGTTTFIQSEKFNGMLVPLFKRQLDRDTKEGFIAMNKKLKLKAENSD
jgi:hypothetical protein